MEYQIKVTYWSKSGSLDTSDGENHEELLSIKFKDLEVAKANLKRIDEYNKMYDDLHSYRNKNSIEDIINANKDKDWFVTKIINVARDINNPESYFAYDLPGKLDLSKYIPDTIIDHFTAEYSIRLKTDEGKDFQFMVFWSGYFEQFIEAEIIQTPLKDEGLKISKRR